MAKNAIIAYRFMTVADIPMVSQLVARVFNTFIAPEYSPEGVQEFHRYLDPAAFQLRFQKGHFGLVAVNKTEIVGMIEVRNYDHISLLFVDPAYQHQGIARTLFTQTIDLCQMHLPELKEISVNSSPFAVSVYKKFGFSPVDEQQVSHGIVYIPMAMKLSD